MALYWDKICCPNLMLMLNSQHTDVMPDSADHPDWKMLKHEGILVESSVASYKKDSAGFTVQEVVDAHRFAGVFTLKYLIDNQPQMFWSLGQFGAEFEWQSTEPLAQTVVELSLLECLPMPGPQVPIEAVIAFKAKRRSELLRFRAALDEMVDKIRNAEGKREAYIKAKEQIELSLAELHRLLDESRLQRFLSTAKMLVTLKDSTAINIILPALGAMGANMVNSSAGLGAVIGLGLNAFLSVFVRKAPIIDSLPSNLRDFAYLYDLENLRKG